MEQTHCATSQNLPLGELVVEALGEIERLGYSRRSRNRYRAIWNHLIDFSHRKELGDAFSANLAEQFLAEYRLSNEQVDKPGGLATAYGIRHKGACRFRQARPH